MALEFCAHEDVVFDDAPLMMVLTQVKFPPILALMSPAGAAGFQAGIRGEYPTMLPTTRQAEMQVGLTSVAAQATAPVFKFTDAEGQWKVGISAEFVSLETPAYTHIDEFLDRFQRVVEVVRRTLRPSASMRVGLRKVNSFTIEGQNTNPLRAMFRSELLGLLGVEKFPAPIGASFSQTAFADDENALVMRYGLVDPEAENETRFMLDIDYFTERPYSIGEDSSITDTLRYFSEGITSLFHWSLIDEYKESLKPRARTEEL